jgi:hypothetical protein
MRDRRGVVQESPALDWTAGKDYARGTNFTCMATRWVCDEGGGVFFWGVGEVVG